MSEYQQQQTDAADLEPVDLDELATEADAIREQRAAAVAHFDA